MIGLDLVKRALKHITAYQSGETIAPQDAQDVLDQVNALLDLASTNKWSVFGSNENIFSWIVGQNQYRVGNPKCTDIGLPVFTGTVTSSSPTITGVTQIPSGLVAGASYNQVGAGSTLTDTQNLFPANTYCTAFNAGAQTVTMSANATANSQGLDQVTYTLPGDFPISRPLRITYGLTRINQLDFEFDVYGTQDEYLSILYKAQPGPWPVVGWYNNQFPYGILNVYQTPGQGASVHLFTDTILSNLTLGQTIQMPQGYIFWLEWATAELIWPDYHSREPVPASILKNSAMGLNMVKALNAQPAQKAKYDRMLIRGNRPDGGWITHGGFR
jgi:hypothetical protein